MSRVGLRGIPGRQVDVCSVVGRSQCWVWWELWAFSHPELTDKQPASCTPFYTQQHETVAYTAVGKIGAIKAAEQWPLSFLLITGLSVETCHLQ